MLKNKNLSEINNPEAKRFFKVFTTYRQINRDFYQNVKDKNFDYRITNNSKYKSDSIRENLIHQIRVEGAYLMAINTGELKTGAYVNLELAKKSKKELLEFWAEMDNQIFEILKDDKDLNKIIRTKWNPEGISVVPLLWVLNDHEILHNGINIAFMDALQIPRFESLKAVWG